MKTDSHYSNDQKYRRKLGETATSSPCTGSVLGITSEKTVWCSRCSKWEQQDANQFQKSIKALGWTSVKRKWLCPDCSKQNTPIQGERSDTLE